MDPPLILGTRFLVGPDRATLRYFGAVRGTTGVWLGVEYDDPARGKHSGEKDGEQYFTCKWVSVALICPVIRQGRTEPDMDVCTSNRCSQEGAGAFIRPTSPRIILPRSFLKTVLERYAPVSEEPLPDSDSLVLGRTNIQVNAPRLTKVRDRLGRTQELRELGVEAQCVGVFDEEEANQMESMGPWRECLPRGVSMGVDDPPRYDRHQESEPRSEPDPELGHRGAHRGPPRAARGTKPQVSLSVVVPVAKGTDMAGPT